MGDAEREVWVQSGRVFSAREIAQIRETVAWMPKLPRTELAATVGEHMGWQTVTGLAIAQTMKPQRGHGGQREHRPHRRHSKTCGAWLTPLRYRHR